MWSQLSLWKKVLIVAGILIIASVQLWHSQSSTSPKQVSEIPIAQLKGVYVTKGPHVFPYEPAKWEELVGLVGKLPGTSFIGSKGDSWGALVCLELDWGESGRYWIRLQSRQNLGDKVIANMEEPLGKGSFHHKGHYDGKALFRAIMSSPPKRKGFLFKTDGPGCPPRQGVKDSPLLTKKS